MRPLHIDEIGGAKVARSFCSPTLAALGVATNAKGNIAMGAELPVEALRNIPKANRDCLIENRFIQVWPCGTATGPAVATKSEKQAEPSTAAPARSVRHVIPTGFGRYMVIEGVMLGTKLSREDAEKLAGKPAAAPVEATQAPVKAAVTPKRKRRKKRAQAAPQRQEEAPESAQTRVIVNRPPAGTMAGTATPDPGVNESALSQEPARATVHAPDEPNPY